MEPDTRISLNGAESSPPVKPVQEEGCPRQRRQSPWGLVQMIGCFIAACSLGICHHFYYSYLDGKTTVNQSWYLAAGNAISYLARIFFAASIGLCIRQWFWKAMRARSWTLGMIDKLHGVRNSPSSLLDASFASTLAARAPLGLLITIFVWLLPLVPIIAPTSLSVSLVEETLADQPIQITNLDLSRTSSQAIGESVNFVSEMYQATLFGAGGGGYSNPSSRALGLVYSTFNGGQILPPPSPCNGNCTFNQTFFGPSYKCDELTPLTDDPADFSFNSTAADWNAGVPDLSEPYVVTWYSAQLSRCNGTTVDGGPCPAPANGTFTTPIDAASSSGDGRFWIFYRWLPPEHRDANRTTYDPSIWEYHKLECRSYNASFNVTRTYRGSDQAVFGTVQYLNPLNYSQEHRLYGGQHVPGEYAGYAIHDILFSLMSGIIGPTGAMGVPTVYDLTQLAGSRLVEPVAFPAADPAMDQASMPGLGDGFGIQKPVQDLAAAIAELHFNATVGMLSIPDLVYLANETVPSTQFVVRSQWTYDRRTLAAVYGAFVAANALALVVGLAAVADNAGVFVRKDGFLRLLMATRNPDLDRLVGPVSDGRGDDREQSLLKSREVRFGYLLRESEGGAQERRMVGFGLPDSVVGLGKSK